MVLVSWVRGCKGELYEVGCGAGVPVRPEQFLLGNASVLSLVPICTTAVVAPEHQAKIPLSIL